MPLPIPNLKTMQSGDQTLVWDIVRKKWVVLTPEEMVRQATIHYLHYHQSYPLQWMAVEKQILLHGLKKRFDLLIYDRQAKPWLMVECKAPTVAIDGSVFDQIARYNLQYKVPYLIVTNGDQFFCAKIDHEYQTIDWLSELPPLV